MESTLSAVLKICSGRLPYGVVWCMWEHYLLIRNVLTVVVVMARRVRMLSGPRGGARPLSSFVNTYLITIVELIKLCWA